MANPRPRRHWAAKVISATGKPGPRQGQRGAIGHAIPGVEGLYNRHKYADEKAAALQQLADLVEHILHPPRGNVVPLRGF